MTDSAIDVSSSDVLGLKRVREEGVTDQYLPFAKLLFEWEKNHLIFFKVTCDKIDCFITVIFMNNYVVDFQIRTPKCKLFLNNLGSYGFCNKIETLEQMAGALRDLFERFGAMKFNNCIGRFESISEIEVRTAIELAVGDLYCEKCKPDECCVCKTMTVTKTQCGHFICVLCRDQLKRKKCPMCRKKLTSILVRNLMDNDVDEEVDEDDVDYHEDDEDDDDE